MGPTRCLKLNIILAMSSASPDTFASRLRSERVRLGMSQLELAAALGLPPATYRNYEAGRTEPQVSVIVRLDELGADVLWMMTGRAAMVPPSTQSGFDQVLECARIIEDWAREYPELARKDIKDGYMRIAFLLVATGGKADFVSALKAVLPRAA